MTVGFEGQVAIVTGAGRGLGRLYALDLAARGAAVVVNDLGGSMRGEGSDASVADEVVAEIRAAGGRAVASHDSVATSEGGAAIVQTALDAFGRLDAVVSNAGIFGTVAFEDMPAEDWRRMIDVHLHGSFYLGQPAFRAMKQNGYGRFVFIASSAGLFGQPMSAHYAAAKSGIFGLSNVIALEGMAHGISSNCVLPFGHSRMVTETMGDAADIVANHAAASTEASFLTAIVPELVVPIVTYLASRDCTVTHQAYSACAGRFARVFAGLADGWVSAAGAPTADDIAAHFDAVSASEPHTVPGSIFDEILTVCDRLGVALA
jgi:NAD(P)-dependent dehydrogenase (short-subunit alcohol dehydrogenase family)